MQPTSSFAGDQALIALNIGIGDAERQRDADFLSGLLSDALQFRRANGSIVDKSTYLRDLKDPCNNYEYLVSEDVAAQIYEGAAVVTLRVRAKGTRESKPFEGIFLNI